MSDVQPGARIGSWTVVHPVPSPDGVRRVHCRCLCGNRADLVVAALAGAEPPPCGRCEKSREASRVVNAAVGRKPSPPPLTSGTPTTSPAPPPRRATIAVPSVKVTLPLRPEQLPRDVLPREGGPNVPIELVIEVEAGAGRRALVLRAAFNSRNYRRAVKAIDEGGGNATVLIQGRLTGDRELLDAGIAVQPKTPTATSSSGPA